MRSNLLPLALTAALALTGTASPQTSRAGRPAVPGPNGIVTAGHPLASSAGLQMLLRGGNATDAAVATLAVLGVVRPQMSGAGGNGFFTIYDAATHEVYSLNATGAAPAALDAGERTPDELSKGIYAGVVPGLLGGWIFALDRFGTMTLGEVLEPAIAYAENGHPLEASVARSIAAEADVFRRFETSRRVFLDGDRAPEPNTMIRRPDLAKTLRRLVESESAAIRRGASREEALASAYRRFYEGDIAHEMARFYESEGGLFRLSDFAAYRPRWTDPVRTTYRGYEIHTSPSTSRGGLEVALQLNLVEGFDLEAMGHNSAESLHVITEAIKLAKADIYAVVADPAKANVPYDWLLDKERARRRAAAIDVSAAMAYPSPDGRGAGATELEAESERSYPGSTDSFSIVDRFGNAVSCTPTHGSMFGTGVVVGRTGLTFNNGTRHGSTAPYPEHVNYARGGQIPILNNSPIIVTKDGVPILTLGTPGGETIGQTQFQVLVNVLDHGMPIQDAIEAARISLDADPNFYRAGSDIKVRVEGRVPEARHGGARGARTRRRANRRLGARRHAGNPQGSPGPAPGTPAPTPAASSTPSGTDPRRPSFTESSTSRHLRVNAPR